MNSARRASTLLAPAAGQDFPGVPLVSMPAARLRGLRFADAADLTMLHQDPVLRRLMLDPVPTSFLGIASLIIRANRMHAEQPGLGIWHASDRDGRFLGLLSLLPAAAGEIELGFRLLPSMATHEAVGIAVHAVCRHAFDSLGLLRLSSQVHSDDAAAARGLDANGLVASDAPSRHGAQARAYAIDHHAWARRESARATANGGARASGAEQG